MLHEYAAIDPLALIFPNHIYVILAEKLHPHVPKVEVLREAAKSMSPEEKRFVATRARLLGEYAKAVQEAVG